MAQYVEERENVTCNACVIVIEGGLDLEDVKLSGHEPEMTEEEYRRLFNLGRTAPNVVEVISEDLAALVKTGKSFTDMTMEEKSDHIEFLSRCYRKIKVFKSSAALLKQEEMMQLSEEERERVREHDKKYKPKPRPTVDGGPPKERAQAKSAEEKLVESLAKQLFDGDLEQAREYIAKRKAGKK